MLRMKQRSARVLSVLARLGNVGDENLVDQVSVGGFENPSRIAARNPQALFEIVGLGLFPEAFFLRFIHRYSRRLRP